MPVIVVKISAIIFVKHLTNVINNDLLRNSFNDSARSASVRSVFKKVETKEIQNYQPASFLKRFSKSYETILYNQVSSFSDQFLSEFNYA